MLKPSDFIITNFSELAQGQTGLCVGVRPYYKDYKNLPNIVTIIFKAKLS